VVYGSAVSFTVTPGAGYGIASVSGCGGTPQGPTTNSAPVQYQTGSIASDCTVTASFTSYPVMRVPSTGSIAYYYNSLQAAYNDPGTGSGDTIACQSGLLAADSGFNAGNNISVTINGGYAVDFSSVTGVTTLSGNAEIVNGSVDWGNFNMSD
jgi:hypothetical protein